MAKDRYEISLWEDYLTDTYSTKSRYLITQENLNNLQLTDVISSTTILTASGTQFYLDEEQITELLNNTAEIPTQQDDDVLSYFYLKYRASEQMPYKTYRIGEYYWSVNNNVFTIWSKKYPTISFFHFSLNSAHSQQLWTGAHYEERKIATIGSDSMTTYCRAVNPQLVENINGTNTLTFTMYYTYIDEDGIRQTNPFLEKLVNERRVKAFWKNKWYDFVIKNCQEDSNRKSITYTCQDLFINELSKNGFNIELNSDLNNNQGTASELAARVLDKSDWIAVSPNGKALYIDDNNEVQEGDDVPGLASDIIKQEIEEPLFITNTLGNLSAKNQEEGTSTTIPANSTIYIYYNPILQLVGNIEEDNSGSTKIQFAYGEDAPQTDLNSQIITNMDCWESTNTINWTYTASNKTFTTNVFSFKVTNVSSIYKAKRLLQSQATAFDPLTQWYCQIYDLNGQKIYGYTKSDFSSPLSVNNLVVNYKDFVTTEGWSGNDLSFTINPPYNNQKNYDGRGVLHWKPVVTDAQNKFLFNDGLRESYNYLPEGMTKGQQFIFRYKCYKSDGAGGISTTYAHPDNYRQGFIGPRIYKYEWNDGIPQVDITTNYINYSYLPPNGDWNEVLVTCVETFSKDQLFSNVSGKRLGFFFQARDNDDLWIEEIQFFSFVEGVDSEGNRVRINPGEMNANGVSGTRYFYYDYASTRELTSADNIEYLWNDTVDWVNIGGNYDGGETPSSPAPVPVYNTDFRKIRSIDAKQSNRFNILQSIAETFQCWARFTINRDEATGRIQYIDGVAQKFVTFVEEVGQQTGIGFIYGIDLNTIKRTIASNQIVTKTIVPANSNEFAPDGLCDIGKSDLNFPRVSYILNFDYYINHKLLDENLYQQDLYNPENGLGYYVLLQTKNDQLRANEKELSALKDDKMEQDYKRQLWEQQEKAISAQITDTEGEIATLVGKTSWSKVTNADLEKLRADKDLSAKVTYLTSRKGELTSISNGLQGVRANLASLTSKIDTLEKTKKRLIEEINALDEAFYTKYSRFIQEGSWQSEEYVDPNLYYLDAQSVAYTSSRPQVSYDISVIRLSSLDEFKHKIFHLGDIAYIQDTEFFGYLSDKITPYKELVLVSEITSYFDEPEKDVIKVQNYKTQFEDLFQRIAATTQSLQYATGSYVRAAAIVEPGGTINSETLQNSIAVNEQLVIATTNDLIRQDGTGITVTDGTNPNKQTKINSGGLFITTDGGQTWKNAIRGEGVATQYLTSGSVNTNTITLYDGEHPTFRWDAAGLNAFSYALNNETGEIDSVDRDKFVRFDRFGIYGMDTTGHPSDYQEPQSISEIRADQYAMYGLTWDGLFIRSTNSDTPGYIEISTDNAIRVIGFDQVGQTIQENERIHIGAIGTGDPGDPLRYGIQIKKFQDENNPEVVVMETADDGSLWLRDRLSIGTASDDFDVYLGNVEYDGERDKYVVFNANDKFIVYNDGTVVATAAEIEGDISALTGNIGGWVIANGQLESISTYEATIDSSTVALPNAILSGAEAKLTLGNIIVDGANSSIRTDSMGSTYGFSITPDLATFNNVNVAGKISTVVFEYDKVQTVGGSMLFKPSFKITDFNETSNTIILDEPISNTYSDNYFTFITSEGKIVDQIFKISPIDGKKVDTINFTPDFESEESVILTSIVVLGPQTQEGNFVKKPFAIGINSNDGSDGRFLLPRGISMSEFAITETTTASGVQYTSDDVIKVFIGDLNSVGQIDGIQLSGYGLYADNVYLKGAVVARNILTNTTAGIDTNSNINSEYVHTDSNDDPVIIWAGAASAGRGQAAFQITRDGYLYAQNGRFEGGIYTKSTIEAARITTAQLVGKDSGLQFYDTLQGISFYEGPPTDPDADPPINQLTLTINTNGLSIPGSEDGQQEIIELSNDLINIYGNSFYTLSTANSTGRLQITDNIIQYYPVNEGIGEDNKFKITVDNNLTSIGNENEDYFVVSNENILLQKHVQVANNTEISYGANFTYKVSSDGYYDLYVV